ncbi:MAG TPA: hypothetical protein VLJ61_00295 [Pyrinomonadaceae bacterium]|nr:hypothetical protein [Pyrinomonadaceae bacterium]
MLKSLVDNGHREVKVSNIRASTERGCHRVAADVDGVPLWYESDEIELLPAPEAFGTALLLPALQRGRRLTLDAPVSAKWLSNVGRLLDVWREWWDYPPLLPRAATHLEMDAARRAEFDETTAKLETALCFSGGVDSFYSLLHGDDRPRLLVAAHGFDIPLRDTARMDAFKKSLRAVAASVGAKPVVIRTNFREHPAAGRSSLWERAHGGALAALGHLLSGKAGRLIISSTYNKSNPQPWGSSFMTDHFWSSGRMEVAHRGAEMPREEKVRLLAREPLAREHLRVCWENSAPHGNCSRCAKCVVTMVMLAEWGALDDFPVFDGGDALAERVDALPYLKVYFNRLEKILRRGRLEPELAGAVRRLVRRSRRVEPFLNCAERLRRAFA